MFTAAVLAIAASRLRLPNRVKSTAGYWSASEVKLTVSRECEFLCQMGSDVAQNGGRRHRVRAKTYAEDARGLLVPTATVRRKAPPARTVRQSNLVNADANRLD